MDTDHHLEICKKHFAKKLLLVPNSPGEVPTIPGLEGASDCETARVHGAGPSGVSVGGEPLSGRWHRPVAIFGRAAPSMAQASARSSPLQAEVLPRTSVAFPEPGSSPALFL